MKENKADRQLTDKVPDSEVQAIFAFLLIGPLAGAFLGLALSFSESLQSILLIVIVIALVIGFFKIMLSPISRFID